MKHISVLTNEILEAFAHLAHTQNPLILDATLGFGGHTLALLEAYPHIQVIGVDRDAHALELARERLCEYEGRVRFIQSDFGSVWEQLKNDEKSHIKAILADIGVSSMQLDSIERGFGFASHTLDMRMDTSAPLSAKEVLNTYNPDQLERIFSQYGEIRESKKLVRAIVQRRQREPFASAREFSELCAYTLTRTKGVNPATQAFQAIRIEVNDELGQLQALLDSLHTAFSEGFLRGARLGIISFHSLEDRITKNAFKQWSKPCVCPPHIIKCVCGGDNALGTMLYKKPIVPSAQEIAHNHRSRSAKLRVFDFKGVSNE